MSSYILIEYIRSHELDYGEELDLETQELICKWIQEWFDSIEEE